MSIRLVLIAFALWLGGCVTATVEQVRQTQTLLGDGDSIVVIGRRNRPNQEEAELDFIDCVSRKMSTRRRPGIDDQRTRIQGCRFPLV